MTIPSKIQFIDQSYPQSSSGTMQAHTFHMGRILLEMGKITSEDTARILQLQKRENLLFGEAAIQLGLITDIDIQQVLACQFEHPFLRPEQGSFSPELMVAYQPFSAQVDSIRAVRSQLMMRWFSAGHQSIAVIGISPGSESSVFIANLAVLFSQLGKHTLLIDANLRHPNQQDIFKLKSKQGLSDYLAKRVDLSEVVSKPKPFMNLAVLTAGTLPPNPSELLSRATFVDACVNFTNQYDIALYDTPDFITSSDALLVAAHTGGVLLVIHKNKTRFADITAISEQLIGHGVNIIGTVLIDL